VPVEPDPITHNIDPTQIEAAITPQTRAILPVHLYGQPAELDVILNVARCNGLRVIEDAAQAHGARYKGKRIGAHGDIVCWSFYPGKNLGAMGDAGGITTNDKAIAQKVTLLRNYGSRQKYVNETVGSNSRLDPIQAGVLRVKMRHLDKWTDRRRDAAATYADCLQGINLNLPQVPVWSEPAWHLYVVRTLERDVLQSRLMEEGIDTIIHYPIPPHMQRAYTSLRIAPGALPISQKLASTVLSLPMGPHLSSDEIVYIAQTLQHLVSDLDLNPSKSGQ
jgi:dTDP-4-amino-4,6-dideoxygalactose transaminase